MLERIAAIKLKGITIVLIEDIISLGNPCFTKRTEKDAKTGEFPIFYVIIKIIKNLKYLFVKNPLNFFKTSKTLSICSDSSS